MKDTRDLTWSDALLLGFKPMDDRHEEFVRCVTRLQATSEAEVAADMEAMCRHLTAHFEEERDWMAKTSFPAMQCHIDEHDAVMRSAVEVEALVREKANVAEAKRFAAALAGWFPGHADYMDASLSTWMSKQAYGGAPVVLRRGVGAALAADMKAEADATRST